jgi:hypothetical protein
MTDYRLQTKYARGLLAAVVAVAAFGLAGTALADRDNHAKPPQYNGQQGPSQSNRRYQGDGHYDARHDTRWNHDYYYPRSGYVAPYVPRGAVIVTHSHHNYWYDRGVWYAPYGSRFVVVAPPLGVYVSILPPYYTTVWFGGLPYYYANDTYYAWRASQRAYEVVQPPAGALATTASPAAQDIYVYPKAGQTPEQTASDRYECHRWAADQTGFDPTRPEGGVSSDQVQSSREEYFRAMTACLEGCGYSVK